MSLITTLEVIRNTNDGVFRPPLKTASDSSCSDCSSSGRQQVVVPSAFYHPVSINRVSSRVGTADILDEALGVTCEHSDDENFDSENTTSDLLLEEDDYLVEVNFAASLPSEDYYGSRKMPRSLSAHIYNGRLGNKEMASDDVVKREFLMDDMKSFEEMLKSACDVCDDSCDTTSCCSSDSHDEDDSFVAEWQVAVKFDDELRQDTSRRQTAPKSDEKRELMLDNLQAFQIMLDSCRNGEEDDLSCSSSEGGEEDFDFAL
jgi:hypothetical protein